MFLAGYVFGWAEGRWSWLVLYVLMTDCAPLHSHTRAHVCVFSKGLAGISFAGVYW